MRALTAAPLTAWGDLVAYVTPLLAVLAILGGHLLAGRPTADAGLLLLLLVVAGSGWLAGEGPTIVVTVAATLAGASIALRPVPPASIDWPGDLFLFGATAIVTAAVAVGLRRRGEAGRAARERRLEETELAREAAERRAWRLARLQHLTESVARQLEPHDMAARILDQAVGDVGAVAGTIIALDPVTDEAHVLASLGLDARVMARWSSFPLGQGLPATDAIRAGRPLVFEDASLFRERFPGLARERPGVGSAIVVPLPYEDRIVGALYLRYPTVRQVSAEEMSFLMAVAAACAAAVERSRLYAAERAAREAAERAADRLAFLADASQVLAASLDLQTTLQRLTGIAVPRIADWCAVRLVTPSRELSLAAVAHSDPARLAMARDLVAAQPARLSDATGAGAVARTGRREVVPDLREMLRGTRDLHPAVRRMLDGLDLRTVVTVPLEGRGQIVGVLTLAWAGEVHRLDDEELALADELASRAATALENSRLHGDLEAHAERLQARTAEQAAIARLGQRVLGGADLPVLFDDALQTARSLTSSDSATLARRVAGTDGGEIVRTVGRAPAGTARDGTWLDPILGEAFRTGGAVRTDETAADERSAVPEEPSRDGAGRLRAAAHVLTVPVAGPGTAWGAIVLERSGGGGYDRDDENFVGSVANVLAAAVDRARQERELTARDERLELTLASSRTGTWEWDREAGRIELSDEACALYGLRRSSVLRGLDEFVGLAHPDDRDRLRDAIQAAVEGRGEFELEYRIRRPDGSLRWANGVGRVFGDDGVARRLLGIVRDISERKASEAEQERRLEAEREARQVGRAFIGVVSHELRTPITSIYAGSKLLQRGSAAEDRREEIAHDVEAEAERLYRLTEDLLVLTRLERGDLRIGGEPVLIGHVVRRVVASEQGRWPRVRFHVRERETTEPALGEEIYVEQVVRNLLSNAAKYSPPGSRVDVAVAAHDRGISVRVLDRGPGVGTDPDQLFELFYRAPQTASQASGAGIGLFVCKRLVEAMRGRLWARTRAGGGSEFGFELERYDEAEALAEALPEPDAAAPGAPAGAEPQGTTTTAEHATAPAGSAAR